MELHKNEVVILIFFLQAGTYLRKFLSTLNVRFRDLLLKTAVPTEKYQTEMP